MWRKRQHEKKVEMDGIFLARTVAKSVCMVGELLSYLESNCGVGSKPKDSTALVSSLHNTTVNRNIVLSSCESSERTPTFLLFDRLD